MMRSPSSKRKVTVSETEASSNAGSMMLKWKYPSTVASVVTPKTAPLALKAPSVPD